MGKASRKKKEAKASKVLSPEVQAAAEEAAEAATGAVTMGGGLSTQEEKVASRIQGYTLEIKATLTTMEETLNVIREYSRPTSKEVIPEEKAFYSQLTETTGSIKKTSLDVAKFALLIPLLVSDEVRKKFIAMFQGFLEGLGLGKEKIDMFTKVVKVVVGLLALYWGAKVIKSVFDAFNSIYKLAQLMTAAALITDSKEVKLEKERQSAERGKKDLRRQRAKIRLEKRKAGRLKGFKRLAKILTSIGPLIGKRVISAIPFIGTVASVAFLVAELGEEAFSAMDEAEEEAITKLTPLTSEEKELLKEEGYTDAQIKEMEEEVAANRAKYDKELDRLRKNKEEYEERLRKGLVSPEEQMGGTNYDVQIEILESRMREADKRASETNFTPAFTEEDFKLEDAPGPEPVSGVSLELPTETSSNSVRQRSEASVADRRDVALGDTNVLNIFNNNTILMAEPA